MSATEFKAAALVIIGMMAAVAAYPIIAEYRGTVEPFSELGILGPNKMLGDYPNEIGVDQPLKLYIYVGNHEGKIQYYRVVAKLGNINSTVSDSEALDAPVFAYWDIVLPNEENSTIPIQLSISKVGLNQRLVFELHNYDDEIGNFVYHQRWTQLWLNVYGQGG
jgi:uncharacterized membrane protein